MNESNQIAPLHEAVIDYLCISFVQSDSVLRKLRDYEDELLNKEKVAGLIGISVKTLNRWIEKGWWIMPVGPDGKERMSRQQFRQEYHRTHMIRR